MDLPLLISVAATHFAREHGCKLLQPHDHKYLFLPASPRVVRPMGSIEAVDALTGETFMTDPHGLCSAGPTWMVFGVAGEGHNRDLMVRTEMIVGAVTKDLDLAWYMQRSYENTSPFYALHEIGSHLFLFLVSDVYIPLDVGEENISERLTMELVINTKVFDLMPGVDFSDPVLKYVIREHEPYTWSDRPGVSIIEFPSGGTKE